LQTRKRLIVATACGLVFGLVCVALASSGRGSLPWPVAAEIIASRALMGFAIGVSAFSVGHWALHGLLMGLVFSLPLAFGGLMAPETPELSATGIWVWTMLLGMVYGLLIELITSVGFKATQHSA
jgi:hypothetical protein